MIQPTTGKGTWLHTARTLPASARVMGLYVLAGRGTGKSRLLGRKIACGDFFAGIPQVIFDPVGGTIDNFLEKSPGSCTTTRNWSQDRSGTGLSTWT